jgi:hypothetical protein
MFSIIGESISTRKLDQNNILVNKDKELIVLWGRQKYIKIKIIIDFFQNHNHILGQCQKKNQNYFAMFSCYIILKLKNKEERKVLVKNTETHEKNFND